MANVELIRRWVQALRSGKYEQGSGQLRGHTGRHCCLGVMGDVLVEQGKAEWHHNKLIVPTTLPNYLYGSVRVNGIWHPTGSHTELVMPLLEEIGIDKVEQTCLINMNDGFADIPRHSFSQIADYLEERYLGTPLEEVFDMTAAEEPSTVVRKELVNV